MFYGSLTAQSREAGRQRSPILGVPVLMQIGKGDAKGQIFPVGLLNYVPTV